MLTPTYNHICGSDLCATKEWGKEAKITMHRTSSDFCPAKVWAKTITRIREYPGTTDTLTVNTVRIGPKNLAINSKTILKHIRSNVTAIGEDTIGFTVEEAGCHCIRSSFAVFLYINKIRSEKNMLQGRWRSQAFLAYIKKQVNEFSRDLSEVIINRTDFFTMPETDVHNYENHLMYNPDNVELRGEL